MREIGIGELKKIQLDILKHVDFFCRQHDIKYFLSGGSMLGAVRHHGFIPWDDDIDLMLLRDDYEKLIALYSEKDNSKYKLHCYNNDNGYYLPYAKIDNSETIFEDEVVEPIKGMGVNIDIFPIDVIPNEKSKQQEMYKKFRFYKSLVDLKNVKQSESRVWYKNYVLFLSRFILFPLSLRKLMRLIEANAIRYRGMETYYCGVAVWGYGMKEINLRKNWDSAIDVEFEDMKAPIPIGYDDYLSSVYGDYMKLPPEDKRVSHHMSKSWWK